MRIQQVPVVAVIWALPFRKGNRNGQMNTETAFFKKNLKHQRFCKIELDRKAQEKL